MKATGLCGLALLGILPIAAQADVIQIDLRSNFNVDVIVNKPAGGSLDAAQQSIDPVLPSNPNTGYCFVTQSGVAPVVAGQGNLIPQLVGNVQATDNGLPDSGFFAATAKHPDVQLAYRNADNGDNARYSPGNDNFAFFPTPMNYSALQIFGTSANGASNLQVILRYLDGTSTISNSILPDWITSAPTGNVFVLGTGYDRALHGGSMLDPNYPNSFHVFGIDVTADSSKTLIGVEITKTGSGLSAILGATGVGSVAAVPEPASLALLGLGAVGLLARRRR